jgi:hypothetical protein
MKEEGSEVTMPIKPQTVFVLERAVGQLETDDDETGRTESAA